MAQTRNTPDDEAAMLLLRFFGQPIPEASPGPASLTKQTLVAPQEVPSDAGSAMDALFQPSLLHPVSNPQGGPSTRVSFQQEQDGVDPGLAPANSDRLPHPITHNLKRKRTANISSDGNLAGNSETRFDSELSDQASLLEPAASAPRASSDLPHFMGYDNQSYRCICGTTIEPEAGTSIQCESCLAWQHAGCFGLGGNELEGTTYFCQLCSDERGKHQPDEVYVKYIRQLADMSVPAHLPLPEGTRQTTEESVKETKRSRFNGSSRGKGRTRHSVSLSKPIEAEVLEMSTLSAPVESIPAVLPRTHRKKSLLSSRSMKSKASPLPGPITQEGPLREETQDDTTLRENPSDQETSSRVLDYIPISRNMMPLGFFQFWNSTYSQSGNSSMDRLEAQPTSSRHPASTSTNSAAQLTFVKAVLPDNPMGPSVRSSEIAAEEHECRPLCNMPIYGVFARSDLPLEQSIGQIRGEIYSLTTYVQQPANQYAVIGLPKPFVQRVAPPFDIVVDARRYGDELRFIRSSCDANAALLPSSNPEEGSLKVEISLTRAVRQGEEITLPWAWDEYHLVHELRESQAVLGSRARSERLAHIGRHLARVFKSCACKDRSTCLMARFSEFAVERSDTGYVDNHTQLPTHGLSDSLNVSQKKFGWQQTPAGPFRKGSPDNAKPLEDSMLLSLEFGPAYDLDHITYEYVEAYDADHGWAIPSADQYGINDLADYEGSEDTERRCHQDFRSSLSEGSASLEATTRSDLVWSTASQSDMDVTDEVASVSETSTLTEPLWQDDHQDDPLDLRSAGPRYHSESEIQDAKFDPNAGLPDLAIPKEDQQILEVDQAFWSPNPAFSNLKAMATPAVDTNIVPTTIVQPDSNCMSKLGHRTGLFSNAQSHDTPVAGLDSHNLDEKPEIHAKKQRIDLTKFMRSGSAVDWQLPVTGPSSDTRLAGEAAGQQLERSHSSIGRRPLQDCTVPAAPAVSVTTPWWSRSSDDTGNHQLMVITSPAPPADSTTSDPRSARS